ncbi:hypothetical protein PV433_11955 [Paenibacillus sp. GYB004]|uniref:hypothetical protein n=1 Tax=Paenibacillus sp. GYB004 TaxID=2994393 RepID=UPI002F96418F
MRVTEGFIHVSMRDFLKKNGWTLIAGQYPGGSDDELTALNVMDPTLARDQSPDPRRHSYGKLVPDLIAYKDGSLLVVEAKPKFSLEDQQKLIYLLSERRNDFISSLEKFAKERNFPVLLPIGNLRFIPTLAFSASVKKYPKEPGFLYIRVSGLDQAYLE